MPSCLDLLLFPLASGTVFAQVDDHADAEGFQFLQGFVGGLAAAEKRSVHAGRNCECGRCCDIGRSDNSCEQQQGCEENFGHALH